MIGWARQRWPERTWAVEDCRQVAGRLPAGRLPADRLAAGERVMLVPPRQMAQARQASRVPGKSDPIDALAVARAALHRIAVTQLRVHPPAQACLMRLQATGKSEQEALRVLKRRLVRVVFSLLQADLDQARPAPSTALLPAHEPAA